MRSWVLHEDAHVIAINKPGGLTSQGGVKHAHTLDDLLWAFARSNGKRPELVHRLDRDTSGVILSAKTKPAAGFLGDMSALGAALPAAMTANAPAPAEAHDEGSAVEVSDGGAAAPAPTGAPPLPAD